MCGRYTLATPDPAALRARFAVGEAVEIAPRYNVAPGDRVLAVTTDREGAPRGELLRWGFVPPWAKSPDTGLKMINARVETVATAPAFRLAFERFRCLVIADGFYEWLTLPGGGKQPHHVARSDGEPFAFAGLWSCWQASADAALRTCTILTSAANAIVAPLHDRMPVILRRADERAWLDRSTAPARLGALLRGLPAAQTAVRPVGRAVNDARYDGPECLAPPAEGVQAALF
ncbi:MAG: SOS response-associated peptidase [Solirubrobacterales bacterium]|nr:SOS response-associated peptidase [Solirubrobacterales bacterium]MBV9166486.1 SOS response-associated peptidase [Solirubrobacterales bacterium]